MGRANAQPATTQDGGVAYLEQRQFNQRKQAFRAVDKLVTARMLAQEAGEGDLLLREITDLTLAAAAWDAGLERAVRSDIGPIGNTHVPHPVQANVPDRVLTPWEEWAPQATSTPRLSPGSSTTLLSPAEDLLSIAASTPCPGEWKEEIME